MLTKADPVPEALVQIGPVEGAVALLAFVVAFYALVVRERKTPYLVNTVYTSTILLYAIVVAAGVAEALIWATGCATGGSVSWLEPMLGAVLRLAFLGAIVFVFTRLLQARNQHINLRTDKIIRHFRWVQSLYRLKRGKPKPYKFNPVPFSRALIDKISDIPRIPKEGLSDAIDRRNNPESGISIGLRAETLRGVDALSLELAAAFLRSGANVQYTSCVRHPYEFGQQLHKVMGSDWPDAQRRAVLIDAYTPHFGFSDSVHTRHTTLLKEKNMCIVEARASYAGLHTAASHAFKRIQAAEKDGEARKPTLVIYEGAHALVDLESVQQYRVFVRHVIPSERLWGGMLTLFVEAGISAADMAVVKSYVDIYLDDVDDAGDGPREAVDTQADSTTGES